MPTIDLSQLPRPQIIESLDYESILKDVKAFMIDAFPENMRSAVSAAIALESEPLNIIAQAIAFREMLLRQRINDAAAGCMLSHAVSTDLDNLAAIVNAKRLELKPATDTEAAIMESDSAFRLRAQSGFEGFSVAGPSAAYEYFARSASGLVADARATSPSPATVIVSILSTEGDGTASPELIATVSRALNDETVRPLADRLTVQSATIVSYDIEAVLYFYPGPESEPILAAARNALDTWLKTQNAIGRDVARSAIMATLHVPGVQRVELKKPAQNVVISNTQSARCTSRNISAGGTDE
ncbi:baseplate J/gp47 family protein [Escherichia coli]|jgi:phage-related baseplate assembly protein|uniref:baseplate assembly protein n=1 Tax=Escherichia coli TaxID=562 RepID=UPI00044FB59B|nr:baseplate J/gp47 family protein [Escherichia coli]EEC8197867.1 baseplate assembly protein [Escherichia coli]EEC8438426.1 baseplate assembly protein [Escherichia coli]EEC8875573.1 baseplate assembly protein [Escherichia coli]EEC9777416.1 baseplate assembly protein [Escherichia coli]EED0579237.1 baseplate assembly protein [Escherichia coli]